jgi:copper chaperone NosL
LLLVLAGCFGESDAPLPGPRELTREAIGHYCQMIVADHSGPKAQIYVVGREAPFWFASVRDAFAFMMLPGEAKNVRAVYVNDMGKAANWDSPEPGTWIDARKAFFVLGSARKGGMGQKETVPFSSKEAAAAFISAHGGTITEFSKVSPDYVLGDDAAPDDPHRGSHGGKKDGGES